MVKLTLQCFPQVHCLVVVYSTFFLKKNSKTLFTDNSSAQLIPFVLTKQFGCWFAVY